MAARAPSSKPVHVKAPGKALRAQSMGNPFMGGPKATVAPGDPLSRTAGQYGKGHSYLGGPTDPTAEDPSAHSGSVTIRGASGGIRRQRYGGLGPGQAGAMGPADGTQKIIDQS